MIPGWRGDGHEVRLLLEELSVGAVCRRPVAHGERTGTCWVYIDNANQLDACIVLIAEGMRAGDRATSDDPDTECLFVSRSSHLAKPSIAALCCARIASRITSKVCFWGQAFSVRLITSCTKSGY